MSTPKTVAFGLLGALLAASATEASSGKPRPSTTLTVVNARTVPAAQVAVVAEERTVRLAKPLAPKARATLRLPKLAGCTVTVAAAFEDETELSEVGEIDVCKEKSVRLTD